MFSQATVVAYNRAYSQATFPFDLASSARDIAVTSWKLAKQELEKDGAKNRTLILYHFKEALSFFDKAVAHGAKCKFSNDWRDTLQASYLECLQDLKVFVGEESDFEKRISTLETFRPLLNSSIEMKADLSIELAMQIFRYGMTVLDMGDYKKSLYCMKECYQPLEEARQWACGQNDIMTEVNVLEEDIYLNQCKAQSLQSRATGDILLEKTIREDEGLNMTAIYEVLDWYKQAILLTRETEIEMEAIAHSRLGKVYEDILKVKYKAQEYFMRTIHLAHSLKPRNFHGVEWYEVATKFVETYQRERLEQETDRWQKDRKKYLDQLKDELEKFQKEFEQVNRLCTEDRDQKRCNFLRFVYNTHPPKRKYTFPKEEKTDEMNYPQVKDLFKKALTHYHPDRNKRHGKKWHVLCEEITKNLTSIYETYK